MEFSCLVRPPHREKQLYYKDINQSREKWSFHSQNGHFESDALSSDLNLRSSTHNQMKAELELFPAVPIDSGVYGRGQKL